MPALTSKQAAQIMLDLSLGREPKVEGAEAEAFRQEVEPEIDRAKQRGYIIDIPQEWVD